MVQGCLNEPKIVLTFLNSCASFLCATVIREPNEWEWASIIMFGVMFWSGGVSRCALERGAESFVVRVCERVFYRALWRGGRASILLCLRSDAEGDAKGRKSDLICLISGEVPMKLPSVDWCQHHPKPLVCACDWWLFLFSRKPPHVSYKIYRPTQ